jgi:hypothetical protein
MSESGIDGLRIVFGLQLSFIDANEFLSFPRFFPKAIVGDSVKPGRKTRFAAEAPQVFVGLEKGFLRKIVRQRDIGPDQIAEQTSHARLVVPDQFRKGVVVVINQDTRNEICIGERHAAMLGQRWGFVCAFGAFQFPNDQVAHADQERDDAERPGAALPVVHRAEEDHQAEPDHNEDYAAPHIRTGAHRGRRREERGRDRLAFRHHFPDRAMKRPAAEVAEEHDRGHNQNLRAEQGGKDNPNDWDGHQGAVVDIEIAVVVVASGGGPGGGGNIEMPF